MDGDGGISGPGARVVLAAAVVGLLALLVALPLGALEDRGQVDSDAVFPLTGVALWLGFSITVTLLGTRARRVSAAAALVMLGTITATGALVSVPWTLYLVDVAGLRHRGFAVETGGLGVALVLLGCLASLTQRAGSTSSRR